MGKKSDCPWLPDSLKEWVLQKLHKEHLGITKMKAVAQNHVWWLGIDKDLDCLTKLCSACLTVKQAPAKAPLHPWILLSRPWQWLKVDFVLMICKSYCSAINLCEYKIMQIGQFLRLLNFMRFYCLKDSSYMTRNLWKEQDKEKHIQLSIEL